MIAEDQTGLLLPVLAYEPDCKLFFCADQTLTFGFLCQPLTGGDQKIESRLRVLLEENWPTGAMMSFCLAASPNIKFFTYAVGLLNSPDNAPILPHAAKDRLAFIEAGASRALAQTATFVRDLQLIITANLFFPDQQKTRAGDNAKRQWTTHMAYGPMLKWVPQLSIRRYDYEILFASLEEGHKLVRLACSLAVFEDSETEAEGRVANAINYWAEHNYTLLPDRFIPLPIFLNMQPFGADRQVIVEVGKFIEHGHRRFRKYNGAAVTITQSMGDLYASAVGRAVVENSANMCLLGREAETISSLASSGRLPLSQFGISLLRTVHIQVGRCSEIDCHTGAGAGVGRLVVSNFVQLLYSTLPADTAERRVATDRIMHYSPIANAVSLGVLLDKIQPYLSETKRRARAYKAVGYIVINSTSIEAAPDDVFVPPLVNRPKPTLIGMFGSMHWIRTNVFQSSAAPRVSLNAFGIICSACRHIGDTLINNRTVVQWE